MTLSEPHSVSATFDGFPFAYTLPDNALRVRNRRPLYGFKYRPAFFPNGLKGVFPIPSIKRGGVFDMTRTVSQTSFTPNCKISVRPIPGRVNPPSGGFSFLASVTASETILATARHSLALRRAALADALRRSTLAQ